MCLENAVEKILFLGNTVKSNPLRISNKNINLKTDPSMR
jgi:hypothetical protein